ncbi:hypothetical protein EV426DRAFT_602791 [Tirmania nivea]|nr:hypothetical protein EV426DRAFT_602791 [Tirmania nivea]
MAKNPVTVIDLTSSPDNSDDEVGDTEPPPADVIPVTTPVISSLLKAYPTRSALTIHLATLPKAVLVGMIVDQVLPSSDAQSRNPTGLAHCVYCHEAFSLEAPAAGKGCRIKHYNDCEDSGELVEYGCCGEWLEYADYDPKCHAPPETELGDYCWEGRHHAVPLKKKNFKQGNLEKLGLDETYVLEGLGRVKLKDALWWQNWEDYGGATCTKACFRAGRQ